VQRQEQTKNGEGHGQEPSLLILTSRHLPDGN
jgi:hypothetical protein